jgi:hypothetical protein
MSVICRGEEGSDKVLALISSINTSNEHDDTDRLVSKESELRSVEPKPKNLGSNLTLGTLHTSNIQVSKSR